MSYNEKSSWLLLVATLAIGAIYGLNLMGDAQAAGIIPPPDKRLLLKLTIAFIIALIIGHAVLGTLFRKDAAAGQDERDKLVMYQGAAMGGTVTGFGLVGGMWFYLTTDNPHLFFHYCVGALLAGAIATYALQIFLYRRGV